MARKSIWLPASPPPPLRIPNAVKAGPWLFVSGTMGGPVGGGLAPEVRGNPALPLAGEAKGIRGIDRKSTRLNSSHITSSYAGFCLKQKIERGVVFDDASI